MNLPHYIYATNNNFKDYVFFSEGPKGRIKKVVRFTKIQSEPTIYNLGFGDENAETDVIDDLIIIDNKDSNIVLATVANTINDFCDYHGNHYIYAKGSTPSRTRLYQIGISGLLDDISIDFDIFGFDNDTLYPFRRNFNYDAFLIKRK